MTTNSISKLHRLFTETLLRKKSCQSLPPQDEVFFAIEDHSVPPPTFAHAVTELPPWLDDSEKSTSSAFPPIPEGSNAGFYGHKWIAKSTSAYITNTFGCPDESLLSHVFCQPPLPYFIASIIHRTHVPYYVITAALVLLRRYQSQLPPELDTSDVSAHLLFIASYIFAVREHWPRKEKVFDNEYWSQISNFAAKDITLILDRFHIKLKGNVAVYSRLTRRTMIGIKEKPVVIMEYHGITDSEEPGSKSGARTLKNKVSSIFTCKKWSGSSVSGMGFSL